MRKKKKKIYIYSNDKKSTNIPHHADIPPPPTARSLACLDVVRLGGLSAAKHVVESGKDVLRQVYALARLAHPAKGDRAHAVEHVGVSVVEPNLFFFVVVFFAIVHFAFVFFWGPQGTVSDQETMKKIRSFNKSAVSGKTRVKQCRQHHTSYDNSVEGSRCRNLNCKKKQKKTFFSSKIYSRDARHMRRTRSRRNILFLKALSSMAELYAYLTEKKKYSE